MNRTAAVAMPTAHNGRKCCCFSISLRVCNEMQLVADMAVLECHSFCSNANAVQSRFVSSAFWSHIRKDLWNFPVTTLSAGALWNLSRPISEVKVLPKKNELDVVGLTDLVLAFVTAMTTAPSATCCMQFDCAGDLLSGFEILESFAW